VIAGLGAGAAAAEAGFDQYSGSDGSLEPTEPQLASKRPMAQLITYATNSVVADFIKIENIPAAEVHDPCISFDIDLRR